MKENNILVATSIANSTEGQLLGLEPECVENLITTGDSLDYSFAHEICDLYDKNDNSFCDYCVAIDTINENIKNLGSVLNEC